MKNIVIGLATAALLLLSSCEDYLDVNQDPNKATYATPDLLLPGILQGVATRASVDVNFDYPTWMGYWTHADGWSGWFDIKQYQISSSNQEAFFNTPYQDYLMDIAALEAIAAADPKGNNYVAISKILKSFVFQYLVDAYGDVPYFTASKGILLPSYDDAKAIYEDLVVQLDTAMTLIENAPVGTTEPVNDVMFEGDMTKWAKFANTVKLRILLRQAYMPGRDAYIAANAAKTESVGYLSADALVNPGYVKTQAQPYYANFGWNSADAQTNARTQYVMNAYIEKVYDDLSDPRKLVVFNPANSSLQACSFTKDTVPADNDSVSSGVVVMDEYYADNDAVCFVVTNGTLPPELKEYTIYYAINNDAHSFQVSATPGGKPIKFTSAGSGTSYNYWYDRDLDYGGWHGKRFGDEGDGLSNYYNKDNGNQIGRALVRLGVSTDKGTADKGALVLSAFESLFLQAEAVQRGYISGDAEELYNSAVKASFSYLGMSDFVNGYLAQEIAGVNFEFAPDPLTLIVNQKYIALCGISGFEAWCEYRRSELIDTKELDPDASMLSYYVGVPRREIPRKLHYPQRELNLNPANVIAAFKKAYGGQEPDNDYQFESRVFWDVPSK